MGAARAAAAAAPSGLVVDTASSPAFVVDTASSPAFVVDTSSHVEAVVDSASHAGLAVAATQSMTVTAERMNIAPGRETLDREEVRKIPGTWGDPFRAVQNLPGVARPFLGFFGELVVRGSAPEDTRLYVDGHEVPLLYHFGGLKSLLNAQMIETVDFIPGGFGAYYGRATGGVLDAKTRTEIPDKIHVDLLTDLFDTGFFLQAPFSSGSLKQGAVTGAIRRSYLDLLARPFDSNGAYPRYYDYQLKADAVLKGGDEVGALFFGDDDALVSGGDETADGTLLHTTFQRLQGHWKRTLSEGRTVRASGAAGVEQGLYAGGTTLKPKWESSVRADVRTPIVTTVDMNVGADLAAYYQDQKIFNASNGDSGASPFQIGAPRNFLVDAAAYAEAEWSPVETLTLVPGVRTDWFGAIDSLTVDPRFAARYRIDDRTTLLAATGLYHQPPRIGLLGVFVFDLGTLGIKLQPERAVHLTAGVERLLGGDAKIDVYGYYKWMDHLEEINLDLTGGGDQNTNFFLVNGAGRAYGLETIVRLYPTERLFAWVSYSLSRAERHDPGRAGWYPFSYDQTHNLNAVASWLVTPKVRIGVRARFVTGNPYTPFRGNVYDTDTGSYSGIPGPRASAHAPSFAQLDFRIDKTFVGRVWRFDLFADVMNVTNRRNLEFPQYEQQFYDVHFASGLPILPMIGFEASR